MTQFGLNLVLHLSFFDLLLWEKGVGGKALLLMTEFLACPGWVRTVDIGFLTAIIRHSTYYLKERKRRPDPCSWKAVENSTGVTTNWGHIKQI